MTELLLLATTSVRHYLIRQSQIADLRRYPADRCSLDQVGQALALGPLLDPADSAPQERAWALILQNRRNQLALLVDHVAVCEPQPTLLPLGPLFEHTMQHHWVIGIGLVEALPIPLLDLRCIAREIVRGGPANAANLLGPGRYTAD